MIQSSLLATSSLNFLLPDNVFNFHSWVIFSLDIEFWVDNWFSFTLWIFLFHSLQAMVCNNKWYVHWTAVLLYVLCHFSLGIYHWLSILLANYALTWYFLMFILLSVSTSHLQFSVFFNLVLFYCFYLSGETSYFLQWDFHAMKTLSSYSNCFQILIHSNIWFILGLNSIFFYVENMFYFLDSLDVGKFWIASPWIILICGNINFSGLELQTLYFIQQLWSFFRSLVFRWSASSVYSSLVRGVGPYTAFSDSFYFGIPSLFSAFMASHFWFSRPERPQCSPMQHLCCGYRLQLTSGKSLRYRSLVYYFCPPSGRTFSTNVFLHLFTPLYLQSGKPNLWSLSELIWVCFSHVVQGSCRDVDRHSLGNLSLFPSGIPLSPQHSSFPSFTFVVSPGQNN